MMNKAPEAAPTPSGVGEYGVVFPKAIAHGKRQRRIRVGALVTAVVAIGLVLFNRFQSSEVKPKITAAAVHAPVLTVTVQRPISQPIERLLAVQGTVSAWDPIAVGSTTSGLEVKKITVDDGALVKEGQLLAVLDSTELQAQIQSEKARLAGSIAGLSKSIQPNRPEEVNQLAAQVSQAEATVLDNEAALMQATANLENAQANAKRYKLLVAEGAVSAQEAETRDTAALVGDATVRSAQKRVDAAKFALKQYQEKLSEARTGGRKEDIDIARATRREEEGNVKRLQTEIDQTFIRAPVNGLITRREAHLGDISANGKTMFLIARDNRLELKAQVPDRDLMLVQQGESVTLESTIADHTQIVGTVREISPLVDSETRLATVRIDLPSNSGFKIGMYAEGQIRVCNYLALTVPSSAVISRDEKHTVFIVLKDNQVHRQQVTIGNRTGKFVEIVSGLAATDLIVVDGAGFLKEGDYVRVAAN
jgi:HlyD family secretion protein